MSDIKEKIAKQLMGSKTGLLSSTLAERLTIEKSIINDALEEMRQIQDVKKGSKSGLDNYRWTMTDMGRLNYRVDESLLTQTEKTTIETPQAAPIVEESPLAQKQITTTNVAKSTVESEKQAKTSPVDSNMFDWTDEEIDSFAEELFGNGSLRLFEFKQNLHSMFKSMRRDFDKQITSKKFDDAPDNSTVVSTQKQFPPEKVRELAYKLANFTGGNTPKIESYLFEWLEQNQPSPQFVGLSDEMVADFWKHSKCRDGRTAFIQSYKNWEKTQTFTQSSEAAKAEITRLEKELADAQIAYIDLQKYCSELKSELNARPVIGLSDEQVRDFYQSCFPIKNLWMNFLREYKDWQKTQTFLQPEDRDDYEQLWKNNKALASQLRKAQQELEQLKSQQFQPDWSNVPDLAEWIAIDDCGIQSWHELEPYYDEDMQGHGSEGENGTVFDKSRRKIFKRPQPPAPTVEVGQVWRSNDSHEIAWEMATIIGIDDEAIAYRFNARFKIGVFDIEDFIAKFERVS